MYSLGALLILNHLTLILPPHFINEDTKKTQWEIMTTLGRQKMKEKNDEFQNLLFERHL